MTTDTQSTTPPALAPSASAVLVASVAPVATAATATPVAPATPVATAAPSVEPAAGPTFDQPWATAVVTDVTTGEQFSLAGLTGSDKVVFVETMAIWCSNCRAQQREAVLAFAELDPERVIWVGLDVEHSETPDALARYRDQNQFPFLYAIANRELASALASAFGDVVLSPPSVNLIILGADGNVTHLLGHHSAAQLVALAAEHGA